MQQRDFDLTPSDSEVDIAADFAKTRRHLQSHHLAVLVFIILGGILIALFNIMALPRSAGQPAPAAGDVAQLSLEIPPCLENCTPDELPEPEAAPTSVATPEPQPTPSPTPPPAPPVLPPVSSGEKLIALTFDDGPSGAQTPRLLNYLAQAGVSATFFVLGNLAERAPQIIARAVAEGHEVASHSYRHADLRTLGAGGLQQDLAWTAGAISAATGVAPAYLRPPYGSYNRLVQQNAGVPLILWSVDPQDWRYRNANTVYNNVVSRAHNGAIILLHDIHGTSVDAVPRIISTLQAQGYRFLTVSQLFAARGVTPAAGGVYTAVR